MPKSSNHLALARQWELLKLIPSRAPGVTASELRSKLSGSGYQVSKRTVERDLNDLARQFGIACNEVSKPYGWHWLPGAQHGFGGVDLIDAVSLTMAGDVLRQVLPSKMLTILEPKLEQARKKLSALREHPLVRFQDKVRYLPMSYGFVPPTIPSMVFEAIQKALVEERQIAVRYAAFNSPSKALQLHPLSLIQRGNTPYLVATAFDYDDVLLFAVHRFNSVEVTDMAIRVPAGYSVDQHIDEGIMDFGQAESIRLRARLSDELAVYLAETPVSVDQKLSYRDGGWQVTATVRKSWQLHFWILSQGAGIEVLAPKELRRRICHALEHAYSNYDYN